MSVVHLSTLKFDDVVRGLSKERDLPKLYQPDHLRKHANAGDDVGCLLNGARLIGFYVARIVGEEAELLFIYVCKEFRACGFGKPLLRSFVERAQGFGAVETFLEVNVRNEPALGLYLGAGFEEVGRRRGYYSDGADALIMKRQLNRVAE